MGSRRKFGETGNIAFASTSIQVLVTKLRAGEAISIKQKDTSGQNVYLGFDRDVSATTGYKMDHGEVVSVGLEAAYGKDAELEIWALSGSTSNNLSFIKVPGHAPDVEAT